MRLRASLAALSFAALALATPAQAHGNHMPPPLPFGPYGMWGGSYMPWSGAWQPPYEVDTRAEPAPPPPAPPPADRDSWLRECRHRLGDNGVGGALIGGAVGGLAGNVIAGHGDKVVGTIAGAAVGAVAGAVIDKAEDAPRVRDRCEAMLEGGPGYGPYGYAPGGYPQGGYAQYGYAPAVMMVPVMMVPAGPGRPDCHKTVTTTTEYIDVPRRARYIPRRAVPDTRVKIVPDTRVPIK